MHTSELSFLKTLPAIKGRAMVIMGREDSLQKSIPLLITVPSIATSTNTLLDKLWRQNKIYLDVSRQLGPTNTALARVYGVWHPYVWISETVLQLASSWRVFRVDNQGNSMVHEQGRVKPCLYIAQPRLTRHRTDAKLCELIKRFVCLKINIRSKDWIPAEMTDFTDRHKLACDAVTRPAFSEWCCNVVKRMTDDACEAL